MDTQPLPSRLNPGSEQGEEAILRRAQHGDQPALRQLVQQHQARVFGIALRLTGRHQDAEELAQDVFIQMQGALAGMASPAHLMHWLLRTVSHRSIDRLRRYARQGKPVPLEALDASGAAHAPESMHDPLAAAHLHRLLLQLQPDARAVMLLRYQEDLDPTDIVAVLDMPLATVKSHLRRSLDWLRTQYPGDDHEP